MYKLQVIQGDLKKLSPSSRGNWEEYLNQDILIYLSKKEWKTKTRAGMVSRLQKLGGQKQGAKFTLTTKKYGRQVCRETLPGLKQGYVNIDRKLEEAEQRGYAEWSVLDYYDRRAPLYKSLKGATVRLSVY